MNQHAVQNPINLKVSNSVVRLDNLVNSEDKICLLKKCINWSYLNDELGYLFKDRHAPPIQLILGLLYLQSIDNLPYSDVMAVWKKSPEWQYFCGEKFLNETFPLNDASLSIWSRVIGSQGRTAMTRALGTVRRSATLH